MRKVVALVIVAGALAAAGCMGGDDSGSGSTTTVQTATAPNATGSPDTTTTGSQPSDTGATGTTRDAAGEDAAAEFGDFVLAAGSGNALILWDLLTEAARERLGPNFDSFQITVARELEEGLGSFAGESYEVLVATEVEDGFAVVAIAGVRESEGLSDLSGYAVVLRDERGGWKVELGAPVVLAPALPESGAVSAGERPEITVGVEAQAAIDEALLWLDGKPLAATLDAPGDGTAGTLRGWPAEPLETGPHVAVAFARAGDDASARAWVVPAR